MAYTVGLTFPLEETTEVTEDNKVTEEPVVKMETETKKSKKKGKA